MKNKDFTVLIDGLRKLSADLTEIADQLSVNEEAKTVKEEAPPETKTPEKVFSKEEVRAVLADKSRSGFRAEVKALLTAHGAKQLSDISNPKELAALVKEAEVIGNG